MLALWLDSFKATIITLHLLQFYITVNYAITEPADFEKNDVKVFFLQEKVFFMSGPWSVS